VAAAGSGLGSGDLAGGLSLRQVGKGGNKSKIAPSYKKPKTKAAIKAKKQKRREKKAAS
jgi:hypothetical protein